MERISPEVVFLVIQDFTLLPEVEAGVVFLVVEDFTLHIEVEAGVVFQVVEDFTLHIEVAAEVEADGSSLTWGIKSLQKYCNKEIT